MTEIDSTCVTDFKVDQYLKKWVINFRHDELHGLKSKNFLIKDCYWTLYLELIKDDLQIKVNLQNKIKKIFWDVEYTTNIVCCILDFEGKRKFCENNPIKKQTNPCMPLKINTIPNISLISEKEILSHDRTLTILLDVEFVIEHCFTPQLNYTEVTCQRKLVDDFEHLFKKRKFCDITLKLKDGSEIQAHKAILAARSDVFSAMFEHEMVENRENCIEITDFDSLTCQKMLHFIYTDNVPNIGESVEELLAISDKYDIELLKLKCSHELASNTSIDPVKKLILADRYRLDVVKKQAIKQINSDAKHFIKNKDFQELCHKNLELFDEIYLACVTRNDN